MDNCEGFRLVAVTPSVWSGLFALTFVELLTKALDTNGNKQSGEMPGGLGSSGGFHSVLNGGCLHLSRLEMEGAFSVCASVLPLLPSAIGSFLR